MRLSSIDNFYSYRRIRNNDSKKADKPDEKSKIEKMRRRLENRGFKANCEIMPVELAPALIQTIAATAPKIFFLTRRCLKGRNVVCVLSLIHI